MEAAPARALIERLDLQPHPEGGWYREHFRSSRILSTPRGPRSALTSIYFLLETGQVSRWHVLEADEIWHFHSGEPLELLTYAPETRVLTRHELVAAGSGTRVAVVPAGTWQAAQPLGAYALAGCTVAPGFEFEDFRFVADLPELRNHRTGPFAAAVALL